MSPRLASRISGTCGWRSRMWAHTRSSAPSARWAAKWAICGLNAHTRSAVASTMAMQNRSIADATSAGARGTNGSGSCAGSGSRPMHSIDPDELHAAASLAWKLVIVGSDLGRAEPVRLGAGAVDVAPVATRALVRKPAGLVVDHRRGIRLDRVAVRAGARVRRDPGRRAGHDGRRRTGEYRLPGRRLVRRQLAGDSTRRRARCG